MYTPIFRKKTCQLLVDFNNSHIIYCSIRKKYEQLKKEERGQAEMEYWDIYDVDKQPTGRTMKRNDWNMKPGDYHLTVLGVLQNREGKYLITKRVMTKAWAAGWWEVSGGGVQAGESSIEAVRREVIEETGIDVSDFDGGLQFTYRRDNPDEKDNYFVDVYKFTGDFEEKDVRPQEAETDGFKLATLDEIKEYAEQGIFLHYDSIKKVFE